MPAILIVDDTAVCREPIAAILRRRGFTVHCAQNGRDALELMPGAAPDLILLDLAMPVMDGITFLRTIRGDTPWRHVPVVLLTAMSNKDRVEGAEGLGIRATLLKAHFSLTELVECINRFAAAGSASSKAA